MDVHPRARALLPRYRSLLNEADRWFTHAAQAHREDGVHCGRGCHACCLGLFDISAADALLVAEGYRRAKPSVRHALGESAASTLASVRAVAPEWQAPWLVDSLGEEWFDRLCDALPTARCPALADDGSCRIYDHRPLICRIHGLPMYDPADARDCGGACDLNFAPAGLEARPALHFEHGAFARREAELNDEIAGQPTEFGYGPTFVAAALWRAAAEEESGDER